MNELTSTALETILGASPFGIAVFDSNLSLIYSNEIADNLFGTKTSLNHAMKCGDFIGCKNRLLNSSGCGHSRHCPTCPLFNAIQSVCRIDGNHTAQQGEAEIQRDLSQPTVWIQYKVTGIVVEGRKMAVVAFSDITSRKQDEDRLRDTLAEIAAIYEHAPIAMVLLDKERRVQKANGFAATFSHRQAESMVGMIGGKAFRCLHHLDSEEGCGFGPACKSCKIRMTVLETFATGVGQAELEAWLPFEKSGISEDRCLLINTAYINLNDAERVLLCAQDITERKRFEMALQESEVKFRLAFDASPDAVNINRQDGTYIEINQGFTSLTGFSKQDVIGKTLEEVNLWCIPADREKLVNSLMATGYCENLESKFRLKDGGVKTALMSARLVPIDNEPHVLSITRDISERVTAEQTRIDLERRLQQAQKMESVGRLAGGIAHDLNNMLGPIIGYAEMLVEDLGQGDPRLDAALQIVEAGTRAEAIIRQLLAYSRKQALEMKAVHVNTLLHNFEQLLRRMLREDIVIHMTLDPNLPQVNGDIGQLEQVVMNLAINAQDAMPDGGELTFKTQSVELDDFYAGQHQTVTPGSYVLLSVSDTGVGMDEKTKSQIFEPFFTTKGKTKGTGLGLASVYGIVKQHGGNIWVYSYPGEGTTFKIYLPMASRTVPVEPPGNLATANTEGNETILIVEDDGHLRSMTRTLLSRKGYTTLLAANGPEALDLIDRYQGQIDLLLTDVIMPGMDGRELAHLIKGRRPQIKILYMSGYPEDVITQKGLLEEALVLQKPFTLKTLSRKIRMALAR